MTTSGKIFEAEIRQSLKWYEINCQDHGYKPLFWWRFNDTYDFVQRWCPNCKKAVRSQYISVQNPADFGIIYRGTPILLELKSSLSPRYRSEWIKPHQIGDLEKVQEAGGRGYFIFGYRASLQKRRHPDEKAPFEENRAFALIPRAVKELTKRKSFTWAEVSEVSNCELVRREGIWVLDNLLSNRL